MFIMLRRSSCWLTLVLILSISHLLRGGGASWTPWQRPNRGLLDERHVRFGNKTLLAVRVSSYLETPAESAHDIQAAVFGLGPETSAYAPYSAVAQLSAITHNQLVYNPAVGPNVVNGVLDIEIDDSIIVGTDIFEVLIPTMHAKLKDVAPGLTSRVDRIMFCLPTGSLQGSKTGWSAFTYIYGQDSYYQRSTCTQLPTILHELGHGCGFHHSNVGDVTYRDKTGYMGSSDTQHQLRAFNGHKHWISGWFDDRALEIIPSKNGGGGSYQRLVSFVDYSHDALMSDDLVVLRVGDLYLQYNRAKGYNADAPNPDTVTITHASSANHVSDGLAALSEGESFLYPVFPSGDEDEAENTTAPYIVIEVCALLTVTPLALDYAIVHIYLVDSDSDEDSTSAAEDEEPASCIQAPAPPPSTPGTTPTTKHNDAPKGFASNIIETIRNDALLTGLSIAALVSLVVFLILCAMRCCGCCCFQRKRSPNTPTKAISSDENV